MSDHKNYGQTGIGGNFEIGKKGPRIKDNAGVIEHRNQADNSFAIARGADPVGPNDLVTKKYLETQANVSVTAQIDGGAVVSGSFVGQVAIVTTAGGTYSLKELYYWDGSAWVLINTFEGMRISVTDPLSGGTDTYLGDHLYLWDEDGSVWVDIGPGAGLSNVVRHLRRTITFNDADGVINISNLVPANAIVLKVKQQVSQAFNGTTPTIKIGDAGDDDRFATVLESCIDMVGIYVSETYHLYGTDTQVIATLAKGGSTAGQVNIVVEYVIQ